MFEGFEGSVFIWPRICMSLCMYECMFLRVCGCIPRMRLRMFVCFPLDGAAAREAFKGPGAFYSTGARFCMASMFLRLMMVLLLLLLSCGPVRVEMSWAYFVEWGRIFDRREAFAHC